MNLKEKKYHMGINYRRIGNYFTRVEFFKRLQSRIKELLYSYYDETRAAQIIEGLTDDRVQIVNIEKFFIDRFFINPDIGHYAYVRSKDFASFVRRVIIGINKRRIAGHSYIDLTSVFLYMTEIKNSSYFVRKTIVYYDEPVCVEKGLLDTFDPITTQSTNYKNWRAILDLKTCIRKFRLCYRCQFAVLFSDTTFLIALTLTFCQN